MLRCTFMLLSSAAATSPTLLIIEFSLTAIAGAVSFAWPGIGRMVVESVLMRDYAVVSGVTLFISFAFVVLNLIIDLTYGIIDPRVKLAKRQL